VRFVDGRFMAKNEVPTPFVAGDGKVGSIMCAAGLFSGE
jgi:hypothetical protein